MNTVADLASFLRGRWGEEERDADLFHELDCPVSPEARRAGGCGCPCPARILDRTAVQRRILDRCERRMRHEQKEGPCWPLDSVLAFQSMKALALPYELHPSWRDIWYP
ncbi:DUF6221 family protein [Streptomyces phaeochromogenes]|uniref:DUF6221 family protein n=1 Tax=Streptomyces phaeochromogenes TaxID=1923 RepID=UPI002E294B2C|nr:DUF6221 family protein [Streptomyces phaeochromogenes]